MVSSLAELEVYLKAVRIPLRLACKTESDWPMVVSLWYLYQDNHLFCATQNSARVVSYLQFDSRCAFEISADQPPYCGVRGQAIAVIDKSLGSAVLHQLIQRYLGGTENSLAKKLLAKSQSEIAIRIKPISIFTWDFSDRMRDLGSQVKDQAPKICP